MTIPGARTIESILAALPTNASQSIQIRNLGEQLAAAELKIVHLTQKVSQLESKISDVEEAKNLTPDSIKILKYIFDGHTGYSSYFISSKLHIQESVIEYHFDCLRNKGLLKNCVDREGEVSAAMEITESGRSFVVEHFKV